DAILVVPLLIAHIHALLEQDALQVAGERDAVVEGVLLVVDHHDLAGGVVLAELLRGIRAGRAVADDHEASGIRAQASPPKWCAGSVAEKCPWRDSNPRCTPLKGVASAVGLHGRL